MGNHFVLGETIEAALARAADDDGPHHHHRYSFDMLGEGAHTAADAARYLKSYAAAIEAIGRAAGDRALRTGREFPSNSPRCIRATRH